MVEHCGAQRDTPYCPECGKRLGENVLGIQGLKRHIDARIKSLMHLPQNEKNAKNLHRWNTWQTALKELMDASG